MLRIYVKFGGVGRGFLLVWGRCFCFSFILDIVIFVVGFFFCLWWRGSMLRGFCFF